MSYKNKRDLDRQFKRLIKFEMAKMKTARDPDDTLDTQDSTRAIREPRRTPKVISKPPPRMITMQTQTKMAALRFARASSLTIKPKNSNSIVR